ncbi:MAG: hypothetical protein QOJ29_1793 [Thermoleophilaceae bacterium]|jgi:hypothetical protein|nr:hypothetical protein [Thermoleophilaceae bacterium]
MDIRRGLNDDEPREGLEVSFRETGFPPERAPDLVPRV